MLFSQVAEVFFQIEKRSARLEMTDLLSSLFKKCNSQNIDKVIYLVQGILLPPQYSVDLGMGEKFAIAALASASGYSKSEIEKEYKKSGDLGISAEFLISRKKQMALSFSELYLEDVYEGLTKIAKTSGVGSQDQKIKYLTELLNNSTSIEARFIIRFVSGTLRLGVGDPTILDALSVYKVGDKTLRQPLERAYNICSDLGYVAKKFFEKPNDIENFKVEPFKPLMPALAERLNNPQEIIDKLGKCALERKYDGFRIQCHKLDNQVEIYSRKLEKMTHMFPDIVNEVRKIPHNLIFEGEALAYDKQNKKYYTFQQTMHRKRKHGIEGTSKEFPLNVFVFDLLYLDGIDFTQKKYSERREEIEKIFIHPPLIPSNLDIVSTESELDKIFQQSITEGLEGIMAKDLNAIYNAGARKFAWIKLKKSYGKSVDTIDAVIVGYYLGLGSRAEFEFGGLLVAVYNDERARLETVAKIGSGFSEEEMKELQKSLNEIKIEKPARDLDFTLEADIWVEPKFVIEIAFDEITESTIHTCAKKDGKGLALRFPRMSRLRDDKGIKEITTSREVLEMKERSLI